jgi:hypothetical protein
VIFGAWGFRSIRTAGVDLADGALVRSGTCGAEDRVDGEEELEVDQACGQSLLEQNLSGAAITRLASFVSLGLSRFAFDEGVCGPALAFSRVRPPAARRRSDGLGRSQGSEDVERPCLLNRWPALVFS